MVLELLLILLNVLHFFVQIFSTYTVTIYIESIDICYILLWALFKFLVSPVILLRYQKIYFAAC